MEHTKIERVGTVLLGIALIGLFAAWAFSITRNYAYGSAPSGLPADGASSSIIAVTSGTVSEPQATSSCASTIIATASTTAMVGIGAMVPTAAYGYFQAASTTKEYDGGIYGCGSVKIFPFATGALTVTRTN